MTIGLKRVGIGALVLALALLVGLFKPGMPQDSSEAALRTPGGISAMPSAGPGLAGINNQVVPAIAPASGDGSSAVITVVCDDADGVAGAPIVCPDVEGGAADGVQNITFEVTKVWPTNEALGASFTANNMTTLKCGDETTCDLATAPVAPPALPALTQGVVAVELTGGGVNEVVQVQATDESLATRAVTVIFVETIFAVQPVNSGTAISSTVVSYNCPDIGAIPGDTDGDAVTLNDHPPFVGGADMDWEGLLEVAYGAVDVDPTTPAIEMPSFDALDEARFWTCGGDSASPVDDRVNFETDAGILSVEEVADLFPFVNNACDVGDSVDVLDSPSYLGAGANLCDLDYAPNGVISYGLIGTGDVGVASITGQQSGGEGVLRTINVTFAGIAAMNLFIQPVGTIGSSGGDFNTLIVDVDGRPIPGQTVECSVDPVGGALLIVNQTGTSDATGMVAFTVVPTGASVAGGADLTINCHLDANPDVSASHPVSLSLTPGGETVDLVSGCNAVSSTWADGTSIDDVVAAVSPSENLVSIWQLSDPTSGTWLGWAAAAPASENDLTSVDFLDSIFICASGDAAVERPEVAAP